MNILNMNKKYMLYTSEMNTQVEIFIKYNKLTNKLRKHWGCNVLYNENTITSLILGDIIFNKIIIYIFLILE